MPSDPSDLSIDQLAKYGHFEELRRRVQDGVVLDLSRVFELAVTDFRTVKRNPGHQKILQWCLDNGLSYKARMGWLNESLVCLAARFGNNPIISSLLDHDFPEDLFDRSAIGDSGYLSRAACQCELSKQRDTNGFNLLFSCAASGLGLNDDHVRSRLVEVCQFLLDQGVSPVEEICVDIPIFPAFLCASFGGNVEVMKLLLDHGGIRLERFHQTLEHSLEPHQRSGEPFYHIAKLIIEHGFDLNSRSSHGRTLLHGAANRGTINAVRWLLQNGADPNGLDELGRTPLHVCAERNMSTSVARMLLEAGSDLNATDTTDRTALDYARQKKRVKIVAYLTSLGAR